MRILFLTNFYLAQASGGEDQSCQQVVAGLRQRGHETRVLTSMHGTHNVPVEADGVYRSLYLEMDLEPWRNSLTFFTRRTAREKHNLKCFEHVLQQFAPDIIFIWGLWNLHRSLPVLAEARCPNRVIYRFATYWPTLPSQHEVYWRVPGRKWYSRLAKRAVGQVALALLARENHRPALAFRHSICVSAATRSTLLAAGIPVANARVIHTGIDAHRYPNTLQHGRVTSDDRDLNLLYAGRLEREKGVHTAIQALQRLAVDQERRHIRLTVAGSGSPDYESDLRQLVRQAGLAESVSFLGHVPANEMPRVLAQADVLLVPSTWPEPFSRAVLEGMLAGLVVVASAIGGTPEVLADGENGLLFAPGDADDLARKITRLADDPELRRTLAHAGQRTVAERFTVKKMMDEIEGYLHEVARSSLPRQHPAARKERLKPTL